MVVIAVAIVVIVMVLFPCAIVVGLAPGFVDDNVVVGEMW
jgi:hypothetical protein